MEQVCIRLVNAVRSLLIKNAYSSDSFDYLDFYKEKTRKAN